LIDAIFQLLFRHEKPLSTTQIQKYLGPVDLEESFSQLPEDLRFVFHGRDQWATVPLADLVTDKKLLDTTFIVTDIETTGSIQGKDRIIDLAAIKVKNGKQQERFEQLVDPEQSINRHITQLTGIKNEDVAGMPTIETVMPDFMKFAGDGVFVAHNAGFDFYFIQNEIRRLGLGSLPVIVPICTFQMAKKLLPELKACGITGLSNHFNYEFEDRHRAMPDVEATCHFLDMFLETLKGEGVDRLHKLIQFQKEGLNKEQINKRIKRLEAKQKYRKQSSRR